MAELGDGRLEILPLPPLQHQRLLRWQHQITVLVLTGEHYNEHGIYTAGKVASGKLLPALQVDVDAVMNA